MSLILVVGTGTNVGKSHVTCALAMALRRVGADVVALKPVETGAALGAGDAERLRDAAGRGADPLYRFEPPLSPHLAARRAGVVIEAEAIRRWVSAQARAVTLVETAGGALSPLSESLRNLDLAPVLGADRILVVAPDRLGVLHDVSATMAAVEQRSRPHVLVLSAVPPGDASTGTNAEELARLGVSPVAAQFPGAPISEVETSSASEATLLALGICATR